MDSCSKGDIQIHFAPSKPYIAFGIIEGELCREGSAGGKRPRGEVLPAYDTTCLMQKLPSRSAGQNLLCTTHSAVEG